MDDKTCVATLQTHPRKRVCVANDDASRTMTRGLCSPKQLRKLTLIVEISFTSRATVALTLWDPNMSH